MRQPEPGAIVTGTQYDAFADVLDDAEDGRRAKTIESWVTSELSLARYGILLPCLAMIDLLYTLQSRMSHHHPFVFVPRFLQ